MENNNQLPKVIKLFNFAKKERSLGGVYKISSLPRISEIARNKEDNVKVDLSFYLENNKTPCIKGIINLKIILVGLFFVTVHKTDIIELFKSKKVTT